jgi:hypothetical protein
MDGYRVALFLRKVPLWIHRDSAGLVTGDRVERGVNENGSALLRSRLMSSNVRARG